MSDLCYSCGKVVYQQEKMVAKDKPFHKNCFRCSTCGLPLSLHNCFIVEGKLRCKQHMKDLPAPASSPASSPASPAKPAAKQPASEWKEGTPEEKAAWVEKYKAAHLSQSQSPSPSSSSQPSPSSTVPSSQKATPLPAISKPSPTNVNKPAPSPSPSTSTTTSTITTPKPASSSYVKPAPSAAPTSAPASTAVIPIASTQEADPKAITQKDEEWSVPRPQRPEWASLLRKAESEYEHPSENAKISADVISRVLAGDMSALSMVPPPQKWVRIFISSTFTDTEKERNLLMEDVFPYLNTLCKKLGLEFGTIDMRWGVREFTADNHGTSALCMKELRKCLESSIGPAFVCLLGDKYGYRPFPSEILRSELESMWTQIKKVELPKISAANPDLASRIDKHALHEVWEKLNDSDKKEALEKSDLLLVPQWYKLDENVEPDVYVLLNVSAILPNYISDDKDLRQADSNKWWATFEKLQVLLKQGSLALPREEDKRKYTIAVTHEEVSIGILDNKNRDKQCFCYLRQIEDVTSEPDRNFIDTAWVNGKAEVLQETREMLQKLKQKEVAVLRADHIKSLDVKKTEVGLAKEQKKEIEMYYRRTFCDDFALRICDSIFEGYKKIPKTDHPIYPEAMQHLLFQQDKLRYYVERPRVQVNIIKYLDDNSSQNAKLPFVVHARSGAGKTALMAWAANHCSSYPNAVVVTRFIGVTSIASEIVALLVSICNQLREIYSVEDKKKVLLTENLDDISKFMTSEIFPAVSKSNRPLYLFLDSLDQLLPLNNAHQLSWLPLSLPSKVHLVVSTITETEHGGLHDRIKDIFVGMLQEKATIAEDNFYSVPLLEISEGESILKLWLGQRTLTKDQQRAVLQGFEQCATPLYLRLATDIAFHWKSYTPVSECFLGVDVKEIINTFFSKLEKVHGQVLVQHAMGYLSASRFGLSYSDLEDLLSCDDEVLDEVYHFWTPPIRRLSPLLWSRLRDDIARNKLGPYLTERGVHEVTVYSWYHRQFWEVARARYLDDSVKAKRHEVMALYFEGRFSSPNCIPHLDKKTGKQELQDRLILAQPLKFSGSIFNRHRLTELPYHQIYANNPSLFSHTLYNFEFLETKIDAGMHAELLLDFTLAIENTQHLWEEQQGDRDEINKHVMVLKEYEKFLHQYMYILSKSPHQTLMYALNQSNRLQLTKNAEIQRATLKRHLLLLRNKPEPIDPCVKTMEGPAEVMECWPSPDGASIVSCSSKGIHLWDFASGGNKGTFPNGHEKKVLSCAYSPDGSKVISSSNDGTVKVWDIHSRTCIFTFTEHKKMVYYCTFSPDGKTIASSSFDQTVKLWNVADGKVLFSWETEGFECCVFSPDGKLLAAGGEVQDIHIWYTRTGKLQRKLQVNDNNGIYCLCFSPDGALLVGATCTGSIFIWDTEEGNLNITLEGHTDSANGCCFSPDGSMLATSSNDRSIKIWNPYSGECLSTLTGHSDYVRRCHFTNDGKYLVTGSEDTRIKVWNPYMKGNARTFHHSNQVTCISFSPDNALMATSSYDKTLVIWDNTTDKPIQTLTGHAEGTWAVAFAHDGKRLFSVSDDRSVKVWEVSTGENIHTITNAHHYQIYNIKFAPDGKTFATSCIMLDEKVGDHVKIWNSDTYQLLHTLSDHTDGALGSAFSADGKLYASGSFDRSIIIYDTKGYTKFKVLLGHARRVEHVVFSDDGEFLISGSLDKVVKVWNIKTGEQVMSYQHNTVSTFGGAEGVESLFSWNGYVFSHSLNEMIMWNTQTWRIEKIFLLPEDMTKVTIQNNKLVYGTSEGDVQFYDVAFEI